MSIHKIETWQDLLSALQKLSKEQLQQRAQVVPPFCDHTRPVECHPVIAFGTVNDFEIDYCRSATDNRRHGDEVVLLTDHNPFGEDGAIAYEWVRNEKGDGFLKDDNGNVVEKPIYPKSHDAAADWTGPAQKLYDESQPSHNDGDEDRLLAHDVLILQNRMDDPLDR